jgi:hypothetical protein
MGFENYRGETDFSCCAECSAITLPCPQFVEGIAPPFEDGYDYSHLIGDPAIERGEVLEATTFDQLLTAYERILLGFGTRIVVAISLPRLLLQGHRRLNRLSLKDSFSETE